MPSILPLANSLDLEEQAEGSIDPLGTYSLSESLATRIGSHGVRERQSNLRFLTICCFGWEVISALDPELRPGDPSSSAEQAFEWIVVEALVQGNRPDGGRQLAIPGIQKAQDALKQGVHLNADRYLSMPGTFGFFGVYRTLAEYLSIVSFAGAEGPILGPEGTRILDAWRADQGLQGFGRDRQGRGAQLYRALLSCLKDTFREGVVVPNRPAFQMVQEYLHPGTVGGPKEAEALREALFQAGAREDDDHRRQLIRALSEPKALALITSKDEGKEKKFHAFLLERASPSLRTLLKCVEAYEAFIGVLHGAFDELRRVLTPEAGMVPLSDVARRSKTFAKASKTCSVKFEGAQKALSELGMDLRFTEQFGAFARPAPELEWLETLLAHHANVQRHKPPAGKAQWFEHQNGKVGVRPLYRLEGGGRGVDEYVYFYRTTPLFNFLQSLKVPSGKA